jgi:hypothetical protein
LIEKKCVIHLQVLNVDDSDGQDCKDNLRVGPGGRNLHVTLERERERKGERGGVDVVIRMFYDGKRGRMVWVEADYELWW